MLENRKLLVFLLILVPLLVLGLLSFLWREAAQTQPTPEAGRIFSPATFPSGARSVPSSSLFLEEVRPAPRETLYSSLGPKEEFLSQGTISEGKSPDFFEVFFETIRDVFTSPAPPSTTLTPPTPAKITITPEELFEFAYPPSYLKALRSLNQFMIEDEFLAPGEIFLLTSMKEAEILQDKIADYLEYLSANSENSAFSSAEIELYRKAYREILPKRWEEELRTRKAAGQSSFLPLKFWRAWQAVVLKKENQSLLSFFTEKLDGYFLTSAYALIAVGEECYREGSTNLTRGSQSAAPCCNCGFIRRSRRRWRFVEDCGENGCARNLGCLNAACPNLPAIWDPVTKICGCGL